MLRIFSVITLLVFLSACGQKGALYLTDKSQTQKQPLSEPTELPTTQNISDDY